MSAMTIHDRSLAGPAMPAGGGPIERARPAPGRGRTAAVAAIVVAFAAACGATPVAAPSGAATPSPVAPSVSAPPIATAAPSVPAGPSPIAIHAIPREPALKTVWTAPGPPSAEAWLWNPTVAPNGDIWAASSYNHVFSIFGRAGTFRESWGTPGDGDGEFDFVADGSGFGSMAFRSDGGFYVADSNHSRIVRFGPDRSFIEQWGSFGMGDREFTWPIQVLTDARDNVYVIDDARGDIRAFTPAGEFIRTVAKDHGPWFALDAEGNVLAFDQENGKVILHRFAPDGRITLAVDLHEIIPFATGLAVAPSGNIFIATSDSGDSNPQYRDLIELDPAGKLLHIWPNGGEAFAFNTAGDLIYMIDSDVIGAIKALALPTE
jgi:sugar lactone lactonase YvrE